MFLKIKEVSPINNLNTSNLRKYYNIKNSNYFLLYIITYAHPKVK